MFAIKIKTIKFISDDEPGLHFVQDKVPIVTEKYLDANSEYPEDGVIACEIVREWKNSQGQKIFTVNTSKPWVVDTIEGLTEFDLLEEQLEELVW